MSKYTFTFKKDDVFVEFYSENRDVVEKQFQIWVADADDYVNNLPRRNSAEAPSNPAKVEEEKKTEKSIVEAPKPKQTETPAPQPSKKPVEEVKIAEPVEEVQEPIEQPEVFDKASTLLKTINSIQEEGSAEVKPTEVIDFDTVLEKNIENPTFEPNKNQDPVFLNLVKAKKTSDKFHYLIITAYYLSEFEKLERFSIKQINAKLMQNLSEVIDHTTLQEAINQNFIELVPDLTETSETTEYRLTRVGEEFFAKI